MNSFKYITIRKFSDLVGYSEEAVRQKIKKGVWFKGVHYIKCPDNRILINMEAFEQWVCS